MTDKSWLYCPACEAAWKAAEGRYCWVCKQEGEPDIGEQDEPRN